MLYGLCCHEVPQHTLLEFPWNSFLKSSHPVRCYEWHFIKVAFYPKAVFVRISSCDKLKTFISIPNDKLSYQRAFWMPTLIMERKYNVVAAELETRQGQKTISTIWNPNYWYIVSNYTKVTQSSRKTCGEDSPGIHYTDSSVPT